MQFYLQLWIYRFYISSLFSFCQELLTVNNFLGCNQLKILTRKTAPFRFPVQTKNTKPKIQKQEDKTKDTKPRRQNQGYKTKDTKPRIQTKDTKPRRQNQRYKTKRIQNQ